MPKRAKERPAWDVDFINLHLTERQKVELAQWDESGEKCISILEELVSDGCKVSFSYDEGNDSYIATVTAPAPERGVRKRCFTSRGRSTLLALRCAAFKVEVHLDGNVASLYSTKTALDDFE